ATGSPNAHTRATPGSPTASRRSVKPPCSREDFGSGSPATAAENASSGSGCSPSGRKERAKRFPSCSLSLRGWQHPRTLLLLHQPPTSHKSHLRQGSCTCCER
ncbi:hypothetical protein H1C71_013606, partial [Ictidomys tridecemlineatus]